MFSHEHYLGNRFYKILPTYSTHNFVLMFHLFDHSLLYTLFWVFKSFFFMFYFIFDLSIIIQFFFFLLKILWNRIVTTFLSNKTLPLQNSNSRRRHSTSMPIFDVQPEASDVWRNLPRSRVVLRDPDLRRERRDQPERQIHKNRIFRERSDVLHESSD